MRLTREFEPGWRGRGRIDIFGKSEHLKGAAEHLGMEQRLKRAFGFWRVGYGRLIPIAKFGDDAGKEMMLIGESATRKPFASARRAMLVQSTCIVMSA